MFEICRARLFPRIIILLEYLIITIFNVFNSFFWSVDRLLSRVLFTFLVLLLNCFVVYSSLTFAVERVFANQISICWSISLVKGWVGRHDSLTRRLVRLQISYYSYLSCFFIYLHHKTRLQILFLIFPLFISTLRTPMTLGQGSFQLNILVLKFHKGQMTKQNCTLPLIMLLSLG